MLLIASGFRPLASTSRVGSPALETGRSARATGSAVGTRATRLLEQGERCGRRRRGGGARRQHQLELALFGDADILADQPVGLGGERERSREVCRRRDAHQQHRLVLEAVVDDAADIEQRRRRPDDRIGLGAFGQFPRNLGGQARSRRGSSSRCATSAAGSGAGRPRTARRASPSRLRTRARTRTLSVCTTACAAKPAQGRGPARQKHEQKGEETRHRLPG